MICLSGYDDSEDGLILLEVLDWAFRWIFGGMLVGGAVGGLIWLVTR